MKNPTFFVPSRLQSGQFMQLIKPRPRAGHGLNVTFLSVGGKLLRGAAPHNEEDRLGAVHDFNWVSAEDADAEAASHFKRPVFVKSGKFLRNGIVGHI